jgi:cytochrome c556
LGVAALAHNGATGIVKERMDSMKSMANAVKAIKNELGANGDAGIIKKHATGIARHAGGAMTAMFPKGSRHGPGQARPEIWVDWATFQRSADRLKADATALGQTPTTDAFKTMLGACASCHKRFRAKNSVLKH